MLKAEVKEKLKKVFGLDVDQLETAIKSEKEEDFTVPEVIVMSQTDLDTRDATKVADGKKSGETEAKKIFVQEVGKRLGLEIKGERIGDLVAELQTHSNKTGDEKVKTLQEQVALLTQDKDKLSKDIEAEKERAQRVISDSEIIGEFHPKRKGVDKGGFNEREYLTAVRNNLEFKEDGVYREGALLRDPKTQTPISRKVAIEQLFTERNWIDGGDSGASGGRGGASSQGGSSGGVKSFKTAQEAWKAQNPDGNIISPECMSFVNEAAKENKDFDWNN